MNLLPGVRQHTSDTDRLRVRYIEYGPETGIPVVLIHGNLSTGRFYEHLLPGARIAGLRRGLVIRSYLAPYGQYRQEILDRGSGLAAFAPHAVMLCLDHEHGVPDPGLSASRGDVDACVQAHVADLRRLW